MIWLPRCDANLEPEDAKILTTSAVERTYLGMRQGLKFKTSQNGRAVSEPKSARFSPSNWRAIASLRFCANSSNVFLLSHDGQVEALGDEMALAFENVDLDNFLIWGHGNPLSNGQ